MESAVGDRDGQYIKNKEGRGKNQCGIPYFWEIQMIDHPCKFSAGGIRKSDCQKAGKRKLKKRCIGGKEGSTGVGIEPSVKGIGLQSFAPYISSGFLPENIRRELKGSGRAAQAARTSIYKYS